MNDARRIVANGISPLYEMGVRDERERIIKLLNEMLEGNWDWAKDCDCPGCERINKMFALIKAN